MLLNYKRFISSIFFGILLLISFGTLHANGLIRCRIKLDSSWQRKAYLSQIKDFDALYTISRDMILDEVPIDSCGNLSFDLTYLPKEERIYRIHFVKKGDIPASLIIGGKDENHFFIIANNNTILNIVNTRVNNIRNIEIAHSTINKSFQQLLSLRDDIDSVEYISSHIKSELLQLAIYEKYRYIGDTCTSPLLSLYAIYQSGFESNYILNKEYYDSYINKWRKNKSSYFAKFRSVIPNTYFPIFIKIIILCIIFTFIGFWAGINRKHFISKKNTQNQLTVQERKILFLIQQGKSNQEISEECNVGVSTVKSHVSNIYAKLKINSRKETFDIKIE